MDKNTILSKLNQAIPGAVLEARRFGRSVYTSIWIEAQTIQKVAELLKLGVEFNFNWLENLSVVEFEKILVMTYFIGSTAHSSNIIIRASVVPKNPLERVLFPSIRKIWPMGEPMENEISEMFGVQFYLDETLKDQNLTRSLKLLPENWEGFPLRKSYIFPQQFLGIQHSRPTQHENQTDPIAEALQKRQMDLERPRL